MCIYIYRERERKTTETRCSPGAPGMPECARIGKGQMGSALLAIITIKKKYKNSITNDISKNNIIYNNELVSNLKKKRLLGSDGGKYCCYHY